MHDEATSPELTVYLVEKMNAVCNLNLIMPKFLEQRVETTVKRKRFPD